MIMGNIGNDDDDNDDDYDPDDDADDEDDDDEKDLKGEHVWEISDAYYLRPTCNVTLVE